MKIMLAYYNDLTVFLSTIYDELGFKIDYMGKPTKHTIDLASKYGTESWCFVLKLMLGQALEGHERKNDILVVPGAWGGNNQNCLLGYLSQGVMKKKMESITKKKLNVWHFNLNPIEMMYSGYYAAYQNIALLKPYTKIKFFRTRVMKAVVLGIKKMKLAAEIKEKILESADIIEKEVLFGIYEQFMKDMVYKAKTYDKSEEIFNKSMKQIANLRRSKPKQKITIAIVGDYVHTLFAMFPFFDIEKFLLSENVAVKQPLNFINYYSFLSPIYSKKNREESRKIFPKAVAGSDVITVLTANYLKKKVDGLIHVGTFSCTPEEVASEVLLSHKKMFPPILSLSYDAHTTEENMKVRIEAFIDMIKAQKRRK